MKIFIWGAGGQGRVVLDIFKQNKNYDVFGFLDSDTKLKGKVVDGIKIYGGKEMLGKFKKMGIDAGIIAVGDNQDRSKISDYMIKKGFKLVNAIHPRATIATNASIGSNVTIAAGAIICAHASIGDDVIINTGAIVEHENIICKGCHIASGVKLAGSVFIEGKTFVGIGAVVIENIKIGSCSIIGAGSIVIEDIPENVVAVGVPARIIRKIK